MWVSEATVKRTRYVPPGKPTEEEVKVFAEEEEEAKRGLREGVMEVGYMDESGFPDLPLGVGGEAKGVPRAWGSRGRVEWWGTWCGDRRGSGCTLPFGGAGAVGGGAGAPGPGGRRSDQAPEGGSWTTRPSTGPGGGGEEGAWRERGLAVGYLPRYSPHLNPMESVWRRVKGFLMPRRHYGSLEELKDAVVQALKALGGVELKILGEGT